MDLAELLTSLRESLTAPTTAAAALPDASDLAFERSLSRPLAKRLDASSARVLALVSNVLNWVDPQPNKTWEADGDLVRDGVYRDIVERVEGLLEAADDAVEKHLGVGKAKPGLGALGAKLDLGGRNNDKRQNGGKDRLAPHLLHDPNLSKPQLSFPPRLVIPISPLAPSTSVPGSTALPLWKPVLRQKLNAKSPDAPWLVTELYTPPPPRTSTVSTSFTPTPDPPHPRMRYAHPYAVELATLTPPESFFDLPASAPAPPTPKSFEEVPFEWVGDKIALDKMLREIREVGLGGQKELAVDLEHHDYRSWAGLTCLIQLSTRKKDYVIDVLDPSVRDNLEALNEFFTDPAWIKVFHGAHSDIIWLQRDFGLYIVGLFDTYHATHVLGHARHGLANLLEMYSGFEADKRYQLADWRIRPVPKEMLHYARSDTHFLLDIYDHLRLALSTFTPPPPAPPLFDTEAAESESAGEEPSLPSPTSAAMEVDSTPASSPLSIVFTRSIETSAGVFEILPYDHLSGLSDGGWRTLLTKWRHAREYDTAVAVPSLPIKTGWGPGEVQLEVLKALHEWREKVAREEDESPRFILGNEPLERLVNGVPRTEEDVVRTVGGGRGVVGEVLRKRKAEVVRVIEEALGRVTVGAGKAKVGEDEVRDVVMGKRGEAALEPAVRPVVSSLWDAVPEVAPVVVRAASSSFFGVKAKAPAAVAPSSSSLAAPSSSFFGASKPKTPVATVAPTGASARLDAVARVHASLVLGGGLANSLRAHAIPVAVVVPVPTAPVRTSEPTPAPVSMDHSYVPLSSRLPKESSLLVASTSAAPVPSPKDSDVLVVSSLADKPKKRRRPKVEAAATSEAGDDPTTLPAAAEEGGSASKKQKTKKKDKLAPEDRLAPHDYSTTRSVLDAEPVAAGADGGGGRKKKGKGDGEGKKAKGFEVDMSEFRRQPRVNNQSKKGNVSQSFSK